MKVTPDLTPQVVNVKTSVINGGIGILGVARHIFQVKDLTPKTKLFFEQFLEVTPKNTREANCPKTTCLSGVSLSPGELAKINPVLY